MRKETGIHYRGGGRRAAEGAKGGENGGVDGRRRAGGRPGRAGRRGRTRTAILGLVLSSSRSDESDKRKKEGARGCFPSTNQPTNATGAGSSVRPPPLLPQDEEGPPEGKEGGGGEDEGDDDDAQEECLSPILSIRIKPTIVTAHLLGSLRAHGPVGEGPEEEGGGGRQSDQVAVHIAVDAAVAVQTQARVSGGEVGPLVVVMLRQAQARVAPGGEEPMLVVGVVSAPDGGGRVVAETRVAPAGQQWIPSSSAVEAVVVEVKVVGPPRAQETAFIVVILRAAGGGHFGADVAEARGKKGPLFL